MSDKLQTRPKSHNPMRSRIVPTTPSIFVWSLLHTIVLIFSFTPTSHAENTDLHKSKVQHTVFYEDYYALVVGISQYEHWPKRPEANHNARDVSRKLKQLGFSVKLLIDPTMQELRSALDEFIQKTGQKVNRGLIFYYSGKTLTRTSHDGLNIGWIISKDTPVPQKNRSDFEQKAISTDEIAMRANQIQSKHLLFLFDAALSGDLFQVEPAVLKIVGKTIALPSCQFITAGRADEKISEKTAFTKFLLKGLGGEADLIHDGAISGSELGLYLSKRMGNVTGGKLHPQIGRIAVAGDNRGEFVLRRHDRNSQRAHLFVVPQPISASTRIMNIKPRFTQGMELNPGEYKLNVSAEGYESVDKLIDLKAGEDRTVNIRLAKLQKARTNSLGMQFIPIRQGSFMMGSPVNEPGRSIDETHHRVVLTQNFWMQRNEITIGQFKRFAQSTGYVTDAEKGGGCWITNSGQGWAQKPGTDWKNPGRNIQDDDLPANCITWNDAMAFARWLSEKEGKAYQLPTEAQWEYAGRAAISAPFSTGRCLSTDDANYGESGHHYQKCTTVFRKKRGRPIKAGQLAPNPWRLHNIHGNVSEWCQDWYGPYPSGSATNPKGPPTGSERVMRGGHWQADAAGSRSAVRRRFPPDFASDAVGFRLVMVP